MKLASGKITNQKVLSFPWNEFGKNLEKMIKGISRKTKIPINGEQWEEVIVTILKYMKHDAKWNQGSHKPGADIWIDGLISISAKSGQINKEHLNISSNRLTRFSSLDEMKNYIDSREAKNFDIHLCCSRTDLKDGGRNYKIFLVDAHLYKANSMTWKKVVSDKTKNFTGYRGKDTNGITLNIYKKMSNQLWISYPLELCNLIAEIEIDASELGADFASYLYE